MQQLMIKPLEHNINQMKLIVTLQIKPETCIVIPHEI